MIHVLAIITAKPGMRGAILKEFHANIPAVHAKMAVSNMARRSTPKALRRSSATTPLS